MQVIGICRFSYPAAGGFQVEHDDIAARRDYLYAPDRMAHRFATFETITLPAIAAQTDPDFTFAVIIGTDLPGPMQDRLFAACDAVPQVRITALEPGLRHRPAMKDLALSLRDDPAAPCLQFRLDDDDAVGRGFVAGLRETAEDTRGLWQRHGLAGIDFNHGWLLRPDATGLAAGARVLTCASAGLGIVIPAGDGRGVFNFAHNRLPQVMPVVTRPDPDMFLRGHNDHNDSRQGRHVRPEPLDPLDAATEARLETAFGIDCAAIRRAFAAPEAPSG